MPSVGLNMIVRNEAPVIARCLASVRGLIDWWTIVDTGSTDGTQDRVRAALAGVPGELHERPWVDFAHNRNEALALARRAFEARPSRAEPLVSLARFCRLRGEFASACLFARQAVALPRPHDRLFVDESVYTWRALDELAISAYYAHARAEGREAARRLMNEPSVPVEERARIARNASFYD